MRQHALEHIVRNHIDAYNKKNLDEFLSLYAETIKVFDFKTNALLGEGIDHMRTHYQAMFAASPHLNAELIQIFSVGEFVTCYKKIGGKMGSTEVEHVGTIYQLRKEKIICLWLLR